MPWAYASEFSEIISVCGRSDEVRSALINVIRAHSMGSKAVEGGDREERFRAVLIALVNQTIEFQEAFEQTLNELDPRESIHRHDRLIFCKNWNQRLVITSLGRRYCQTVLEQLLRDKAERCFVPKPRSMNGFGVKPRMCSDCTAIEGKEHSVADLYERLMNRENHKDELSVPMHPYCRHVLMPVQRTKD